MTPKNEKSGKCKHDCGWLCIKNVNIFIFPNGYVSLDFGGLKGRNKLKMICNHRNSGCLMSRNVYLKAEVAKWGKIKKLELGEYKHDRR